MQTPRGMTLIDIVVGTALVLIIFLALFGILRASITLSTYVKSEATANAVAVSQMEYIRSLPYTSIGTVGGIPAGPIAQYSTTTEDGVAYGTRTFIQYYNDPADTSGNVDYKLLKVVVTYPVLGKTKQIVLVSDYAPPSLGTSTGGGSLEVTVVNAVGSPVAGATVTITNASTSPTVNLTTFSDVNGIVDLPGAATSTQYAITVTKSGYSTAQTYTRVGINQNPSPGYMTIVQSQTTNGTFAIDVLGTLTVSTFSPIATSTFSDNFANASKLVALTNTITSSGALTLTGGGNYPASGTAISSTTAPAYLTSWGVASSTMTTPAGTTAVFHVVTGSSGTLVPDTALPGNAAGFTGPVNLFSLSTTTYPTLALEASLTTTASSTTPSLTGWSLSYQSGPIPLPNIGFTLIGAKTIGTTGAGAPIYKTSVSGNTGTTASDPLTLEWDSYSPTVTGYDIVDACGVPPYALSPGASLGESLVLSPTTGNTILVTVTDSSGNVIPGAAVTLSNGGFTKTVLSSSCGNSYFGNLTASTNYTVSISKTGYTSNSVNNVTVSGETLYAISF